MGILRPVCDFFLGNEAGFWEKLGERLCSSLPASVIEAWPRSFVLSVSGGMDSMLLLFASLALAKSGAIAFPEEVFYLNHLLRVEAGEDERLIGAIAKKFRLKFYAKKVQVKKIAKKMGWSLEEAGRNLRYRHLCLRTGKHDACCVILAHHADDYLESVLLHFIRGGGRKALSTMPLYSELSVGKGTSLRLFRPFVYLSKEKIRSMVEEFSIPYLHDKSNQSSDFLRNRLRAQVIPALRAEGLNAAKLWRNFHETGHAGIVFAGTGKKASRIDFVRAGSQPDRICMDRRLFVSAASFSLGGLKNLLDPALLALGLPPAERKMLEEILRMAQRQIQNASVIRWENKACLLWASPTSNFWLLRKNAACLRPFRILSEKRACDSQSLSCLVSWNQKRHLYKISNQEEFVCFEDGMQVPWAGNKHKKLKKVFQEYHLPPFVRKNLPLLRVKESGLVRCVCLSFWEGLGDVWF